MSDSSRVFFLSRQEDFVPIANNGFTAASKTAMEYLMHSLRLENPGFSISSGSIENHALLDVTHEMDEDVRLSKLEDVREVAEEIVNSLYDSQQSFVENDWVFPSGISKSERPKRFTKH